MNDAAVRERTSLVECLGIVGQSDAIAAVRKRIRIASGYDEPVLIVGESGTGKELVARAIHDLSPRGHSTLQVINCGAVPQDLLAGELFGHVAGAFTGATRARTGRIRSAEGSSLLLDEVSETKAEFQVALLRAIELGEVQPVGGDRVVEPVDVRCIATSNRPLRELAEGRRFRRDLYHRLTSFVIEIPPLRDRKEDVAPLAGFFVRQLCLRFDRRKEVTAEARSALRAHSYPGNVRELKQTVFRAFVATNASRIDAGVVRDAILPAAAQESVSSSTTARSFELSAIIREHLTQTIRLAGCNLSEAARLLDIPRTTLQYYTSKYEIPVNTLKQDAIQRVPAEAGIAESWSSSGT